MKDVPFQLLLPSEDSATVNSYFEKVSFILERTLYGKISDILGHYNYLSETDIVNFFDEFEHLGFRKFKSDQ